MPSICTGWASSRRGEPMAVAAGLASTGLSFTGDAGIGRDRTGSGLAVEVNVGEIMKRDAG